MLEEIFRRTGYLDAVLIIISSFAIISFWRGVWGLMDMYMYPQDKLLSFSISVLIGLVVVFLIAAYRGPPKK